MGCHKWEEQERKASELRDIMTSRAMLRISIVHERFFPYIRLLLVRAINALPSLCHCILPLYATALPSLAR